MVGCLSGAGARADSDRRLIRAAVDDPDQSAHRRVRTRTLLLPARSVCSSARSRRRRNKANEVSGTSRSEHHVRPHGAQISKIGTALTSMLSRLVVMKPTNGHRQPRRRVTATNPTAE